MKQWSPSRQGTGMDERLNHKGEVLGVGRAALEMGMIHFHPQSLQIPVHIYIPVINKNRKNKDLTGSWCSPQGDVFF